MPAQIRQIRAGKVSASETGGETNGLALVWYRQGPETLL